MKYVLFVCTHSAGRSQIAEAFFERYAPDDLRAESAPLLRRSRRLDSDPTWAPGRSTFDR